MHAPHPPEVDPDRHASPRATRSAASTRTSAQRSDVDHSEGAGGANAPEDRAEGEALVVVAAAAGADRETVAPVAGDASSRLGDGRRGQEQHRTQRPWGGEAKVLDGGVEQGRVGRHRRCMDELGRVSGHRREARDAAEEAPVKLPYVQRIYQRTNFKITQALVSYSQSLMA